MFNNTTVRATRKSFKPDKTCFFVSEHSFILILQHISVCPVIELQHKAKQTHWYIGEQDQTKYVSAAKHVKMIQMSLWLKVAAGHTNTRGEDTKRD